MLSAPGERQAPQTLSAALRTRLQTWDDELDTIAAMEEAVGFCLEDFDGRYRSQASQSDIVAARFLQEELARAMLFSLPTVPEPELPSVSLAAACPTLGDNAIRGAAQRVSLDPSRGPLLQSVSSPVDVVRAAPDLARAARSAQLVLGAPGASGTEIERAGGSPTDTQTHGIADPQSSGLFRRPHSATATRKLARERLFMEREMKSSKDAVSNTNQQRREQLETLLAPKDRRPIPGVAPEVAKVGDIPDGTQFVVNSRGDIVGTLRSGVPARLSQISRSSEPLGGGKARADDSPNNPPRGNDPQALRSTLKEITGGRIRGQIETDEAAISSALDKGRQDSLDLSAMIVPSAGVTIRVNGRVRKGGRGAGRPGEGGPLQ